MTKAIVIGGGIAGCSTAYALAKRGIAVTLIERHEKVAQEASGNPIAALYPKLSNRPDAAILLAMQGFTFTVNLLKKLPNAADYFNACGLIQLAFNARELARQQALKNNEYAKLIDAKSASEIAGITLTTGGLYVKEAGWVKPQALCQALCSDANISIFNNTQALSIEKFGETWRVVDAKNNALAANIVVICTANDMKQFSPCQSAKITPVRGQINFFAASQFSENIKAIVCSDHFVSPAVAGMHTFGTSYAPNDLNPNISAADTLENLNALRKLSPETIKNIDLNSVQGRVAWRSQTLDYIPLAGQLIDEEKLRNNLPRYNAAPESLPWLQGLYVNAGHGSKGMITAPICGELIANLATQNVLPIAPALASKLNPSRFMLKELGLKQLANSLY